MRVPRIFTPQALTQGDLVDLEEGPSRHLGKVLRMEVGRALTVFNGQGGQFQATIASVSKKHVSISVGRKP